VFGVWVIKEALVAILELKGLGKNFGKNVAVNEIEMSVEEGEIR